MSDKVSLFPFNLRRARERFLRRVVIGPGCWVWSSPSKSKYAGAYSPFLKGMDMAHRVAYMLYRGAIPIGKEVCHTCDNPRCVRPSHLFVGTRKENMQDCVRKGRARGGSSKGSTNPIAKLTEGVVIEIKRLIALKVPYKDSGAEYGISKGAVCHIKMGRSWTHV